MADTIIVYRSVQNAVSIMSDEEAGKFFRAYLAYGLDGVEMSLENYPLAEVALEMSKPILDSNNAKREGGRKGGLKNAKGTFKGTLEPTLEATYLSNVDVDVDKDVDVDVDIKPKKKAKDKYPYGEYSHVLLTDSERAKLADEYGDEMAKRVIDWFDAYIEEKGYKCKSHYLAIKRWVVAAVNEQDERAAKKGRTETPEKYEMDLSAYG